MNLSRNAIILIFALASPACIAPKPGDDLGKPDAATPTADAAPRADARISEDASAELDAEVDEDAGAIEDDAAIDPDAEVIEDGGDPSCVPSGPEICDNGVDDDCENGIDCNDPLCGRCLAFESDFKAGVIVPVAEPCPAGYTEGEDWIFSGLSGGAGCASSCSCTPNAVECIPEIYTYDTAMECTGDTMLSGGALYTGPDVGAMCTTMPIYDGFPGGFRLGNWTAIQSCTPSGAASPTEPSWTDEVKLCLGVVGTNGCEPNAMCYPNTIFDGACIMNEGEPECPADFPQRYTDWYTGYDDTRMCGACECSANGGNCNNATVLLGSDWLCNDEDSLSTAAPRNCMPSYSPPARIGGAASFPTCSPAALEDGALTPIGYHTVCCE